MPDSCISVFWIGSTHILQLRLYYQTWQANCGKCFHIPLWNVVCDHQLLSWTLNWASHTTSTTTTVQVWHSIHDSLISSYSWSLCATGHGPQALLLIQSSYRRASYSKISQFTKITAFATKLFNEKHFARKQVFSRSTLRILPTLCSTLRYFLNCLINICRVLMQDSKKMQQFYAGFTSRIGFH